MVITNPPPSLDETIFSDLAFVHQHGIHDNSILHYFAQSPFYSSTSNNAVLISQAMYNPSMASIIGTRAAFEARLKTMSGMEFMVTQEPAETAPGTGTGVWVISKQTRRKRAGEDDEVTVLDVYYVVGVTIYAAPSVGDIVGSRMLSILHSLKIIAAAAERFPRSEPWLNKAVAARRPLARQSTTQGTSSTQPTSLDSQGSTSTHSTFTSSRTTANTAATAKISDLHLLEETLATYFKHGTEYMDEHLITGQPGDFHISRTSTAPSTTNGTAAREKHTVPALQGRAEWERLMAEELAREKARTGQAGSAAVGTMGLAGIGASPISNITAGSAAAASGTAVSNNGRNAGTDAAGAASASLKIKRKKSKALGAGMVSPTSPS